MGEGSRKDRGGEDRTKLWPHWKINIYFDRLNPIMSNFKSLWGVAENFSAVFSLQCQPNSVVASEELVVCNSHEETTWIKLEIVEKCHLFHKPLLHTFLVQIFTMILKSVLNNSDIDYLISNHRISGSLWTAVLILKEWNNATTLSHHIY